MLIIRGIFFCDIVHAEEIIPTENTTNSYTKYIVIGTINIGILTILYVWFKIETAHNGETIFSDDIDIPVQEYCLALFNHSATVLNTVSSSILTKPELLFPFCFSQLLSFMREDTHNQTFILELKSLILPANITELKKPTSIFNQILQSYAEMYNASNSEKLLVRHLGISHLVLRKLNYTNITDLIKEGPLQSMSKVLTPLQKHTRKFKIYPPP